jgi:hypothetical protein
MKEVQEITSALSNYYKSILKLWATLNEIESIEKLKNNFMDDYFELKRHKDKELFESLYLTFEYRDTILDLSKNSKEKCEKIISILEEIKTSLEDIISTLEEKNPNIIIEDPLSIDLGKLEDLFKEDYIEVKPVIFSEKTINLLLEFPNSKRKEFSVIIPKKSLKDIILFCFSNKLGVFVEGSELRMYINPYANILKIESDKKEVILRTLKKKKIIKK